MSESTFNPKFRHRGRSGRGSKRRGGPTGDNLRLEETFLRSDGISSFGTHTLEEDDLNNDETFGVSLENLGKPDREFDFSGTSQVLERRGRFWHPLHPGFPIGSRSLRADEPRSRRQLGSAELDEDGFHTPTSKRAGAAPKMLSLAEVEAALLASVQKPLVEPIQYPTFTVDWEKVRAERRVAREMREARLEKYNGIMCQSDKDFITRIQLSQLVTASQSLVLDDYYYRAFMTVKLPASSLAEGRPGSHDSSVIARGRSKENQIARMQRQITKIVAESRRRQKTYPVGLENALGKVASKSTRNPKQVLQVLQQKPSFESSATVATDSGSTSLALQPPSSGGPRGRIPGFNGATQTPRERKLTIKTIEKLYDLTLEAEFLSKNRPPTQIENPEDQERLEGMGKKVLPRMLRYLSPDQTLSFITALLANLEELNVCRNGVCPPKGRLSPAMLEEVELFLLSVCPLVLNYVSEAPLVTVNGLLGLLTERNSVVWLSRSKVGLAILTLFLTRIETLRQSGGTLVGYMAPSPEVPLTRSAELYMALFSSLQNHFLAIFPPTSSQIEDTHVWQFLAALSVGLTLEQQHQLVLEVREKVIENVSNATRGHFAPEVAQVKIANVNLFLHALGLDASQVNVQAGR
ncbi:DNA topoisomerase 2-associated protein pat1 [Massospora cicadina]|nr:DNA topoisomerase 2-associated protein pat1 [Massospora cicadina]